jgi:parvulin-like peptidyl-prolyl isomerase
MNRRIHTVRNAGLLIALLAAAAGAAETNAPASKPSDKITELFGDSVIARGTGVQVKRSELDAAAMGIKAGATARGEKFTPEQATMLERQVLDRLIQVQLLLNKATESDKVKGKEFADKRYDVILKRASSEENLVRQLKSVGMTTEELRRKMLEEATAETVVSRELKAEATDADAKKYYEDFPARFEQPEMVRASHILVSTIDPETKAPLADEKKLAKRKAAEDLLKRLRAGEDFAKLAKEFSEDPGSRDNGGEYKFPRGQMVAEFETTAFALATNQISDIVTTQFGYHIIKLSEKIPARKITLDETVEGMKIMDQVKDLLKRQQLEKLLPDYVQKMQKDAKVEILDEKLKQAGEMMAEAAKAAPLGDRQPSEKKTDEKK